MVEILQEDAWCILAWVEDNGVCQIVEYLECLESEQNPDVDKLQHLLQQCAERGPMSINNTLKCKLLEDKIYEFKASGGSRIFWFYDEYLRRVIVCTHGVKKPSGRGKKPYKPEIKRAKAIRELYWAEKQKGSE